SVKESEPMEIRLGHMLSAQALGPGRVSALPDGTIYPAGTVVQLTASPKDGRRFIGWSGDLTSSENPLPVKVDRSLRLFANFECLPGDKKWEFTAGGTVESYSAIGVE